MKKTLITISSIALLSTTLFTGCSQPSPKDREPDLSKCRQDGYLAPMFTCNPYHEGSVVGLGVAKMNGANDKAMQRSEAMAVARDAIAREIQVKVSNLFRSFKATTGEGADSTYEKAVSDVSKQLASQTLYGSKQIGMSWRHPKTKEFFVLVGVDNALITENMEESIKTSFKNDKALYQKFLALKAAGDLDRELEKAGLE